MKKILLLLIIILLFPMPTKAISAHSYIVMDYDSKRVLEGKKYNDEMLIASTSKIMTAYIGLLYGDKNKIVEIGEEILSAYGSSIYLSVGENIKYNDLLYGLMLRSGNDAAVAIAKTVANNMENFVMLMNYEADKIGMDNTNFINAHGLENNDGVGNTSSAYDMALLMKKAMELDVFKIIVNTKVHSSSSDVKKYNWYNKNKLLNNYEYCLGGKTGFTKKASRTLVTMAEKDEKKLIVVTLKDGNDFNDHKALYEKNFKKYSIFKVIDHTDYHFLDTFYDSNLYIKESFKVLLTPDELNKIIVRENIVKKKRYRKNVIVGNVEVILDNKVLFTTPIFTKKGF